MPRLLTPDSLPDFQGLHADSYAHTSESQVSDSLINDFDFGRRDSLSSYGCGGQTYDGPLPTSLLLNAFLGKDLPGVGVDTARTKSRDGCTYNEQLDWMMVLTLPDEMHAPDAAMTAEQAEFVFISCFREDDASDESGLSSRKRARQRELTCFHQAFAAIPDHRSGKGKPYGRSSKLGRRNSTCSTMTTTSSYNARTAAVASETERTGKDFDEESLRSRSREDEDVESLEEREQRPMCFLELLRNVIVAKLVLQCGLRLQMVRAERNRSIYVMISCTPLDLLREADRVHLSTELDVHAVDPQSLEPCTDMFYPLADWYFEHDMVGRDVELAQAFDRALNNIRSALQGAPRKVRKRHERSFINWRRLAESNEVNDMLRGGSKLRRFFSSDIHEERIKTMGSSFGAHSYPGKLWVRIKRRLKKAFPRRRGMQTTHLHRTDDKQQDMFMRFLQLKAVSPLNTNDVITREANADQHAGSAAKELSWLPRRLPASGLLRNYYQVLGFEQISPHRAFEVGSYLGERSRPWIWRHFGLRMRASGRYVAVPFRTHQAIGLVKSILERQVVVEKLIDLDLARAMFPLDTREKVEQPCGWVEDFDDDPLGTSHSTYYWCTVNGLWQKECPDAIDSSARAPTGFAKNWRMPNPSLPIKTQLRQALSTFAMAPPINSIREYYGEAVALYFAFALHFCVWCLPAAVLGVVAGIIDVLYDVGETPKVLMGIMYSFVIACWGTVCMEFWNRLEAKLAVEWGLKGADQRADAVRPSFNGFLRRSPVDFNDFDQFDVVWFWQGRLGWMPRQIISYMIVLSLVFLNIGLLAILMDVMARWTKEKWLGINKYASVVVGGMLGGWMLVFSVVAEKLCTRLTAWENHRTDQECSRSQVLKLCVLEFVSQFGFYFYVGFLKGVVQGCVTWAPDTQEVIWKEPATLTAFHDIGEAFCTEELGYYVQLVFPILMASNFLEVVGLRWLSLLIDWLLGRKEEPTETRSDVDADWAGVRSSIVNEKPNDEIVSMAEIIARSEGREEYGSVNMSACTLQ
eukprot:TRINITY_DN11910_c0_g1_i1.p1 TRINITY_DN11910_c0_g1~~TRINITY_DN11910_c0_g1_i1.p1  ORF type:complete len:1031 (-),score=153.25 TRINITY_DN11910_c0_g1_i1:325-3417(-)